MRRTAAEPLDENVDQPGGWADPADVAAGRGGHLSRPRALPEQERAAVLLVDAQEFDYAMPPRCSASRGHRRLPAEPGPGFLRVALGGTA